MRTILALIAALAVTACVTINIYFPASAAEKAADKIIDEIWQLRPDVNSDGKGAKQEVPAGAQTPKEKP